LQTLEVSAANQWYIRSYGRIAECYFIHNPEPNNVELSNEWYTYNNDFTDEKRRLRQVYGPRVIDMSNENGKALLDFVFGDVAVSRYVPSEIGLPRHWSIYCSSLVEQPAFEVVLQEKKISKVRPLDALCLAHSDGSHLLIMINLSAFLTGHAVHPGETGSRQGIQGRA
jgi:hypothetical protein